jgi:DNA invertase Pin-like site-specific DNA recombinase
MTIYGYARISTDKQDLSIQKQQLLKYDPDIVIFSEVMSTGKLQIKLDQLFSLLQTGDKLVVVEISRMGRSVLDLCKKLDYLNKHNIEFFSMKENIDTQTTTGKFFFNIFASMYEFERTLIRERTKTTLSIKRAKGEKMGGRVKLPIKVVNCILQAYHEATPIKDILREYNISKTTLYSYLKQEELFPEKFLGKSIVPMKKTVRGYKKQKKQENTNEE